MDKLIQVGELVGKHEQSNRVYSEFGICPTIMSGSRKTCTGGFIAPKIMIKTCLDSYKNKKILKKPKRSYKMNKIKVFEAFCGYGSQSIALENIGIPHEVVAISDIDADVLISYGAIRGDLTQQVDIADNEIKEWLMSRNIGYDFQKGKSSIPRMKINKLHMLYNSCIKHNCLGDVSIIDTNSIPDHDLFTYSFPCQDISVAGKQNGLEKGSGTRSGLLWECEKIIAAKKPKYLLMENVKNLIGKQHKPNFDKWCEWLEEQGYKNFYKVLNAKDYGVPQNRERVFMISILNEDVTYSFPKKIPLDLKLKDVLEDVVDDKYYIDNEASNRLLKALREKGYTKNMVGIANNPSSREFTDFKECSPTLCARDYKDPKVVQVENKTVCEQRSDEGLRFFKDNICGTIRTIEAGGDKRVIETDETPIRLGNIYGEDNGTGFAENVWDKNAICPTLTTMQGGNRQPMTLLEQPKTDNLILYDNLQGGKWDKIHESARRVYDENGIAPTVPTCQGGNIEPKTYTDYRIRKLTPKECWRLMGMRDEHFNKCVDVGLSNSQLYKQAGNSIVVNVLEYIFKQLFKEYIKQ